MKKSIIVILISAVLLITGIVLLLFNNKKEKIEYIGIYKKDDVVINVYQYTDEKIYFTGSNKLYGLAYIEDGVATGEVAQYTYKFTKEDDNIKLESNNENIPSGVYIKEEGSEEKVTINYIFDSWYGDSKIFDSKYNGLYQNDNGTIMMYPIADKQVMVIITTKNGDLKNSFIESADNYLVKSFKEMSYGIIVKDDEIEFVTMNESEVQPDDVYNGIYKKVRKLEMEDVINNEILYFY